MKHININIITDIFIMYQSMYIFFHLSRVDAISNGTCKFIYESKKL